MKETLIGIGAAAKLSSLSERTLRYWESLGLIKPVRLPSGHRKFSKNMIKKIIAIKEILDKYNLRINDLITSSKFLQDDLLKDKVDTPDVFDLNITLDSEIYEYAKKNGRIQPLTGLPDALFVQQELTRRMDADLKVAVCYVDMKDFKYYNKKYGYDKGDSVLKFLAGLIYDVTKENGEKNDFVGHLGGDNFGIVTSHEKYSKICSELVKSFDLLVEQHYEKEDREKGYIVTNTRRGEEIRTPIMTLSVAVVWNLKRKLSHYAQASDIAVELKQYAQKFPKSEFVVDRRTN
ncbi:MAG TPA: diguanylate cyclase [Candidatus Goldiibacteriota bacterium]|nr:diguanylate cyclase [Candidatus Goldiibacteriota bacterium]